MDWSQFFSAPIFSSYSKVGEATPESYGANAPITDPIAKSVVGLISLPKRVMDASADMLQTGRYDPAPFLEAAMLPMGSGAFAGLPLRAGEAVLGSGPIRRLPSSSSLALPEAPTVADMARAGRQETVPLSQARSTQSTMQWDKFNQGQHPAPMLDAYADKPLAVKREDGEYLIFDGHHRTVSAINDGKQSMQMHVIDAKDYAPQFAGRKPAPDTTDTDALLRDLFK